MPEKAWMEEIVPGLFLGNITSSYNKDLLQNNKITAIVSLTSRYQLFWDTATKDAGITPERHMWAQVQDAKWEDLLSLMKDICDFIDSVAPPQLSSLTALPVPVPLAEGVVEEVAGSSEPRIRPPHAVLIHCVCGVSRSSTIIAAYLMRKLQMERDAVLQFVKSRKGHIHPNSGFFSQLKLWHESKYTGWENKESPFRVFEGDAVLSRLGIGLEPYGILDIGSGVGICFQRPKLSPREQS